MTFVPQKGFVLHWLFPKCKVTDFFAKKQKAGRFFVIDKIREGRSRRIYLF